MGINSYTEATDSDVPAEEQAAQAAGVPVEAPLTSGKRASQPTNRTTKRKKSASAFRTISEVASDLDVQQHVLRFWETKFSQIRPLKRGGGRRYYRPEDVELLQSIRHLLYTEGYTIKGVQKMLREQGKKTVSKAASVANAAARSSQSSTSFVAAPSPATSSVEAQNAPAPANKLSSDQKEVLNTMLSDLKSLRNLIRAD